MEHWISNILSAQSPLWVEKWIYATPSKLPNGKINVDQTAILLRHFDTCRKAVDVRDALLLMCNESTTTSLLQLFTIIRCACSV